MTTGQSLFPLVEQGALWVVANFKETDLATLKPGQAASISLDMFPQQRYQGVVEAISPASGSAFSLLPAQNATGNWVKVTQRFPLRIRLLNPDEHLRLGASASVRVDTTQEVP